MALLAPSVLVEQDVLDALVEGVGDIMEVEEVEMLEVEEALVSVME